MSDEIQLPELPEPDGELQIQIIGQSVLVDVYRPSTVHDYALDAVLADRERRAQLASRGGVPDGWKLVPVEPTPEMLAATSWPGCAKTDYAHMLAAAPSPEGQEAMEQGGGKVVAWRVPVVQSPFGERLDHGVRDELVLVMHRGTHGWKAAGQGHALLAHQLYAKNVEPLCAGSHEVAVVGLSGGGWRTVWARSDDDVTHPALPSACEVECPACRGAGGHRWHEPDGSENGERCEECEGFGTVAAPPSAPEGQPAEGEEIMVNTPYAVFVLPLQPSGLSSGPRFVVHVPGPEQPAAQQQQPVAEIEKSEGQAVEREYMDEIMCDVPGLAAAVWEEREREEFEAWFSDEWQHPKAVERDAVGYKLAAAQNAWTAWQAGWRAALAQQQEERDALAHGGEG